ncbi:protein phosphatase 1H [Chrysoperla carnea]|uniref:protein phosphatase 1H n=1 Tax=Chrysoperla carnea TaxID=189513 RepID=UPI001D08B8B9|nr:protein phosphatase 1H [Chrysoperla carnea]
MFSRFRNVIYNAVGGIDAPPNQGNTKVFEERQEPKFLYSRPHFLGLNTSEEIKASADHRMRPIIVPRDSNVLPWNTGYAECVNAGKSVWNEDQAVNMVQLLSRIKESPSTSNPSEKEQSRVFNIPYVYFGIFDGHAGVGAALSAANQLHHIIHEKLVDILDELLPDATFTSNNITRDSLIIGALETAFAEMDQLIEGDREKYLAPGGCTALVLLMLLGKLYVANAGDSRGVCCMSSSNLVIPLSNDFTPESERTRIRQLAAHQPHLMGNEFTAREFTKRHTRQDLGKRVLYRDPFMQGWSFRTLTLDDLKMPVVSGEGKRSRVMGTIGVTRGFGDHDLKAMNTKILLKPFLSCHPEVIIVNLEEYDMTVDDVVILGTDGLWDVTSNQQAYDVVNNSFKQFTIEKHRYMSAAQALVAHARGKMTNECAWKQSDQKAATIDDISVFVIPILPYHMEHLTWIETFKPSTSDR